MAQEKAVPSRNWMWDKLRPHIGHAIVCGCYGVPGDPADICIECETCNCVLISAEDFDGEDMVT